MVKFYLRREIDFSLIFCHLQWHSTLKLGISYTLTFISWRKKKWENHGNRFPYHNLKHECLYRMWRLTDNYGSWYFYYWSKRLGFIKDAPKEMRNIVKLILLRTKLINFYGLMGLISYVLTKITNIQGMMPLETKISRDLNVSSHNIDTIS